MEAIGVVGIFVALAFFIIAAMKGYTVLITAPITAAIIILTNQMDVAQYLISDPNSSYMVGLGSFVRNNLPIFVLSAIFGKYLDASGAAQALANWLMSKIGKGSDFVVLMGIGIVTAVLVYGGVSLFVVMFAIIPIAKPIFEEMDLPWHLFVAPFAFGATSFTMCMIPGTPNNCNIITATGCGVTITDAPILGVTATVVTIATAAVYMNWAAKRARAKGEHFDCTLEIAKHEQGNMPGIVKAVVPMIVLIAIIFGGSACKVPNIALIAMLIGIVVAMIVFHKNIDGNHKDVIGAGAKDAMAPVLFTAAATGIGSVLAASSGFVVLRDLIFGMPGGPLASAATMVFVLGAILGTGTAACSIVIQNFLDVYLATGVDPAILYKIMAVTAGIGGAFPNAGSMFAMLTAMGLTHKQGYKHFFAISVVCELIALAIIMVMGSLGIA